MSSNPTGFVVMLNATRGISIINFTTILSLFETTTAAAVENSGECKIYDIYLMALLVVLVVTIVTLLTGNVLVAVVILSSNRLRSREHVFVLALIISSILLTIVVIPFDLNTFICQYRPFPQWWCNIVGLSQLSIVLFTIFNMMGTAVFRYFRVVLVGRPKLGSRETVIILQVLAVLFGVISPITADLSGWIEYGYVDEFHRCTMIPDRFSRTYYLLALCSVIMNLSICVCAYAAIILLVHKSHARIHPSGSRRNSSHRDIVLVKVCFAKFAVFLLCYLPFFIINLTVDGLGVEIQKVLLVLVWLGILISPLLYGLMYSAIRNDLVNMILCRQSSSIVNGMSQAPGVMVVSGNTFWTWFGNYVLTV